MAILTKGMSLSYKNGSASTFTKLTNLTEVPALGGSVEKVDVTTLEDGAKKYINGIKDYGDIAFKFIFEESQFNELNALTGSVDWKVELPKAAGETGVTASFKGEPSVTIESAGVNAALSYTLTITLGSEITFA